MNEQVNDICVEKVLGEKQVENPQNPKEKETNSIKDTQSNTATSLGKFKDIDSLIKAYNSLEAEFTKRCQKIKELELSLEKTNEEKAKPTEGTQSLEKPVIQPKEEVITDELKERVIKDYFRGIMGEKNKAIVMDGSGVGIKSPIERPKNVYEAGLLAKEMFKK